MMPAIDPRQGPPLAVPALFFALAPLAAIAAGALLAYRGAEPMLSSWMPAALAATHLGTLGFLLAVMFGALYQMIPVVVGAPVPAPRLAPVVALSLAAGVAALAYALATGARPTMFAAFGLLGTASLLFAGPTAVALVRAPARTPTATGMRLALTAFVVVVLLGLRLAWAHATGDFPTDRAAWLVTHMAVALVCWVGGLLVAVSWQVVPMFHLTAPPSPRACRAQLAALAFTLVAMPTALLGPGWLRLLAILPGAIVVWLVHPVSLLRGLAQRRRRRVDPALRFWQAGLIGGLLTGLTALIAAFGEDPRLPVLFGWLAIWGWAGLIVHGMLHRIVPFLVWFHRSARGGGAPVPSVRKLLPDARARWGLYLHVGAVVLGAVAIISGRAWVARAAGVALIAMGVDLAWVLTVVLRSAIPDSASR